MVEEAAGVVPIHKESGDVLLVQSNAGHWGFPKGRLEEGESVRAAALRELKEETGVTDVVLAGKPFVTQYSFVRQGAPVEKTVSYFVGTVTAKEVTLQREELQDYVWLPYAEALKRLTYSTDILESISLGGETPK